MVLEENNEDSTSLKIAFEEVDLSEDESLVWNGISSSNFIMENFATAYAWFFFNLEEKFVVANRFRRPKVCNVWGSILEPVQLQL